MELNHESKGVSRRAFLEGGLTAAAVLALAACSNKEKVQPTPYPTEEGIPSPSASPEIIEDKEIELEHYTKTEHYNSLTEEQQAIYEKYYEMSVDSFRELPLEEKLAVGDMFYATYRNDIFNFIKHSGEGELWRGGNYDQNVDNPAIVSESEERMSVAYMVMLNDASTNTFAKNLIAMLLKRDGDTMMGRQGEKILMANIAEHDGDNEPYTTYINELKAITPETSKEELFKKYFPFISPVNSSELKRSKDGSGFEIIALFATEASDDFDPTEIKFKIITAPDINGEEKNYFIIDKDYVRQGIPLDTIK